MKSILHGFNLPMIFLVGTLGYGLIKYLDGSDKLSRANSLCSISYSIGNFVDKDLLGKFDPILGKWGNQAFKYSGQACFYTITHINGEFDSKVKWGQTQIYNTNEHPLILNTNKNVYNANFNNSKDENILSHRIIEDE